MVYKSLGDLAARGQQQFVPLKSLKKSLLQKKKLTLFLVIRRCSFTPIRICFSFLPKKNSWMSASKINLVQWCLLACLCLCLVHVFNKKKKRLYTHVCIYSTIHNALWHTAGFKCKQKAHKYFQFLKKKSSLK